MEDQKQIKQNISLQYFPNHQKLSRCLIYEETKEAKDKTKIDKSKDFLNYSLENSLDILKEKYPEYYKELSEKNIIKYKKIINEHETQDSDSDDLTDTTPTAEELEEEEESLFSSEDTYESESDFSD
jgi:hypothetical protein